ncbi:MAG TPA: hypothetical protein VFH03_02205 [Actinoplanes sp.]|nr:hypothetical protein [Actinoplanes sp.]
MRHSWRDSVATAADLALLGFLVTLAAVPVVTAGAAVLTGSRAVSVFLREDRWPSGRECRAVFRRAIRPGLAGSVVVAVAAALLAADLAALRSGAVPGGVPLMAVVALVALAGSGLTALAVVSWEQVPLRAVARPRALIAASGVTGLVALLALLGHPVLIPVLVGFWLFAVHVGTVRCAGRCASAPRPVRWRPAPRSDDQGGLSGAG